MKLMYPQSFPCLFDGFPTALEIRMGVSGGDIVAGASLGTKFTLTRTPKCGLPQGDYTIGSPLPECRMIYSDTGNDDDFTIKVSFLGYGTFYKLTASDQSLRFQVYKAIAIETAAGEKVFGDTFDCETLIPATQDVEALFSYTAPTFQYIDPVSSGVSSDGSVTVEIGGTTYNLSDGTIIKINSSNGVLTLSYINGNLVFG
uniref:Uncharacterized protein n=1 Tax=Desulfovibrio sp. U5L TaxID=596152 RepID=I2Q1D4_9BACT